MIALGFGIAMTAVGIFRSEGTEIDPMSATNRRLVVRGPFRFTRNPMYLGLVLFSTGIALVVGTWPMFLVPILIFAIANWGHIPIEEAKMHRQHGATTIPAWARCAAGFDTVTARHGSANLQP